MRDGINLALYQHTPQYLQAIKVYELLQQAWEKDHDVRALKFLEYNKFFKDCPDHNNLDVINTYMDSVFSIKYSSPLYKQQLARYVKNKPKEAELKQEVINLMNRAHLVANPVEHVFELIKK